MKRPRIEDKQTTGGEQSVDNQNTCEMSEIKSTDDLQITPEEAIMTVNNEVVVHEAIIIN